MSLLHFRRDLGLLERLGGEVVSTLIHYRIRQHVELTCKGNFETEYLGTLENVSLDGWYFYKRVKKVYLEST